MITFACPQCGKSFVVDDKLAGRRGKCKACGAELVVPARTGVPRQRAAPATGGPSRPAGRPASPPAGPRRPAVAGPKAKLPVRMRRLMADAEMLRKAFQRFPLIKIYQTVGEPPELYQIIYHVRGLARGADGQPVYRDRHIAEIQLTSEYPRQSPKCRMLTPIFHPNIEPAMICIGDHWTAGERLVDLVIRIGEMIAYQAYNIKSPLDGQAAMWADLHADQLPIDPRDLRPPGLD